MQGRDDQNRSLIGIIKFNDKSKVINIDNHPILNLGEKGTFDENKHHILG